MAALWSNGKLVLMVFGWREAERVENMGLNGENAAVKRKYLYVFKNKRVSAECCLCCAGVFYILFVQKAGIVPEATSCTKESIQASLYHVCFIKEAEMHQNF